MSELYLILSFCIHWVLLIESCNPHVFVNVIFIFCCAGTIFCTTIMCRRYKLTKILFIGTWTLLKKYNSISLMTNYDCNIYDLHEIENNHLSNYVKTPPAVFFVRNTQFYISLLRLLFVLSLLNLQRKCEHVTCKYHISDWHPFTGFVASMLESGSFPASFNETKILEVSMIDCLIWIIMLNFYENLFWHQRPFCLAYLLNSWYGIGIFTNIREVEFSI